MKNKLSTFLALISLPLGLHAVTFTVTTTNLAGAGSLQQAILDANANAGSNLIVFNIASGGLTIAPTNPLPALTNPVTIDGSTQPGYSSAPVVEISGTNAGSAANGLVIGAGNCVIRALAINRFQGDNYYTGDAIQITNGAGSRVEGCYLGVERDGVTPAGNSGAGVRIGNPLYTAGPTTSNNVVGGATAAARNLILGNSSGIFVSESSGNRILGDAINLNTDNGVEIGGDSSSGDNEIAANVIAGNQNIGVLVDYNVASIAILSNSICGNTNLGIDLNGDYVSLNDLGDGDDGANHLQNFPVLGFPLRYADETVISGTLNSATNQVFHIELFDNDKPDPSGYGQGQRFLTALTVLTDTNGNGSFVFTNPTALPLSDWITATATDTNSNTSEFSQARQVVDPSSVDMAVTLTGTTNPAPKSVPFVYTIAVTNNGPGAATGVMVTNPLPAGLSYVSAAASQGSCHFSAGRLTCNAGSLAAGAGAVITLYVNAISTGTITDTVSVGADEADNYLPNNTTSLDTSFGVANLAVLASDTPDPAAAGQTVTYTVIATNLGPDAATGAGLVFNMDSSLLITGAAVSQGTISPPGNYLSCALGTIPVNGSATLTVTAIPTSDGTIYNYANVSALEFEPDFSDNFVTEPTTVTNGPGILEFSSAADSLNEGAGFANISVLRLGGAIGAISVDFATSDGTATAGANYVATHGTLRFAAGETVKSFQVPIIDNQSADCNEQLFLHLANPTGGAVVLAVTNATLTIWDNDALPSGIVTGASLAYANLLVAAGGYSSLPSISDDGRYVAYFSTANNLTATPDFNGTYDVIYNDRNLHTNILVTHNAAGAGAQNNSSFVGNLAVSGEGHSVTYCSYATDLTSNTVGSTGQVYVWNTNGLNTLVSVNTNGAGCNGYALFNCISADGRIIAFQSPATDLVAVHGVTNGIENIYVRNLSSNKCELVSVNLSGTISSQDYSSDPAISPDGHYVAFVSGAEDLTAGVTSLIFNIYRRDLLNHTTALVSAATDGTSANNGNASPMFSGDGRFVAFESYASDLVSPSTTYGSLQVYRRDMLTGTNVLVSRFAGAQADSYAYVRGISRDGRYVLFESAADNLGVPVIYNNENNVFLWDAVSGAIALVNVDVNGTGPGALGSQVFFSFPTGGSALSPDGRYVSFASTATNLVSASKNPDAQDVFVRDMQAGVTTMLSTHYNGMNGGNDTAYPATVVSSNGVVAFFTPASDLAQADYNGGDDVFARAPGETNAELLSFVFGVTGDYSSYSPGVSPDGSKIVFSSSADNLVLNDTNNASDVFLADPNTHAITLISANAANNGTQAGSSDSPQASTNGRFVAYHNVSDNNIDQVYLRDSVSDLTTLISANQINGAPGNGNSSNLQITPDGQFVVFGSTASDLVSNDINGATSDIFIHNRTNATCELVSVNAAGTGSANSDARAPAVSADGRFVAFETSASNLGPADSNGHFDVYVRDRQTGSNILCSRNLAGNDGGNADSSGSRISADGSKVIFFSYASDLVAGDTNNAGDLFAFDIPTRTLQLVSKNLAGVPGNGASFEPSVSADGRYVAFYSEASDLVPDDGNMTGDVFVRDLAAGVTQLASVNCSGTASGNNYSEYPAISADGRYVAFHSYATDLTPGDFTSDNGSVFRRDLQAGTTVLISRKPGLPGEGNAGSYGPQISADGSVVSFISSASDLISGDANYADDVFTWTAGLSGIDLSITMTPSAASVAQGGVLSYTLSVTNYGLASATAVVVTDALPSALSFVSATTSQGTFNQSGGLFTANVGTLDVGAGTSITLNTTANVTGLQTNTANTSATESDFNLANNSAAAVVLVTSAGPPALMITATNGNQLFLKWPYPSSGYNLETTTNLAPASPWLSATNFILNNGLVNYLILDVDSSQKARFFRLRHP